jgi:hypothetical protein
MPRGASFDERRQGTAEAQQRTYVGQRGGSPLNVGDVLTWKQVEAETVGGNGPFLRSRHNGVRGVALDPARNPSAPRVMIVGRSRPNEVAARQFATAKDAAPVFMKVGPDRWEYVGRFRAASLRTDKDTIRRHAEHRADEDLFGILFLEPDLPDGLPEELDSGTQYPEGSTRQVLVNAYERNTAARAECVRLQGTRCMVCGFDFGEIYGSVGAGYVHVHHVVPISETGGAYMCNPATDLVPVCANCHAMLHRRKPAYSIAELRELSGRRDSA